jgi:D-3-phosphoglycerate dehydrogenase
MGRIFLTHSPDLANYHGPRAVAALEKLGDLRIDPTGRVLTTQTLLAESRCCEMIVSDRQTPGEATFFDQTPEVVAFLRCAVDIPNIDLAAASRHGVLVTRATPSFAASVAEMALGFMVDLARRTGCRARLSRRSRIVWSESGPRTISSSVYACFTAYISSCQPAAVSGNLAIVLRTAIW